MKRILLSIAVLVALAIPAFAGDYAERDIIGFSPDGAYFAFEQYGVQDGSGFPYSTIFIIDTAKDAWVAGTPVAVLIDDETGTLDAVRGQARAEAAPLLSQYGISVPGRILVSNPATEIVPDPHRQGFYLFVFAPPQSEHFTLDLTEHVLPRPDCPDFGNAYVGFDLALTDPAGGTRMLHRDTRIPQSRGCTVGYGISDVITVDRSSGRTVLIVLLSVYQVGFEGPDRRFIAVATTIAP